MTTNVSSTTDAELMHRVANSDSRALESLYNRYSPILYTVIKKIVGDVKTAEEVLMDVFVIIWRKIGYYDVKTGNAYYWLVTLARNKAVDIARRRRYDILAQTPYDDEYENSFIIPRMSTVIDDLDLKTAMSIKGNIEAALRDLTDAQQYVLYLAYYEGYSETEIAQKLKIPLPTVRSKVQIALTNLRDNLLKGEE